jgi:hypothetical protein
MTVGLRDHDRWGDALRRPGPNGPVRYDARGRARSAVPCGRWTSYITGSTLFVDWGWAAG